MDGAPVRQVLVLGFVVLVVAGPASPVAAFEHDPAPDRAPTRIDQPPSVENELHVELALSTAPNTPGSVTVTMTVENPEAVARLGLERTDNVTLLSTDGFELTEYGYRWDGQTERPTATYRYAVNRSTDGHLGSGATAVDTGSWAILSPPRAPVIYAEGVTFIEHGPTVVVESYEIDGAGVLTSDFVYLGPHRTYETFTAGQTIRLVVPLAADPAADPDRILDTVANASREIRVGGRDETVIGVVVPTTVEWSTGGRATGTSTFQVPADAPLRTAANTWVHEYAHTRDSVATDRSMAWFTEAAATYYGATVPLKRGLAGFGDVRSTLEDGASHDDIRLSEPETWNYESDYRKGALVLGRLDLQIRAASNGTHTLDDAIRRLQRRDSAVDAETFARTVANVSSPAVGAAARRYVTTTATPETWSLSEHARHFGYEPARFTFALADPRAVGPTWSRSLATDSPIQLLPSERLVVDGVVHNDGGTLGAYDVTFRTVPDDDSGPRREDGWLFAGWTRTYTFSVEPDREGEFFAVFGTGRADQLPVRVVEPARNVTVSSVATGQSSVAAGETATVVATVRNSNSRPAQATIPITVDGTRFDNVTVVLSGDETSEITTDVLLETTGPHEIGVGMATTTIRVGTPTLTATDEPTTTEVSTTSEQPTTPNSDRETPTGSGTGPGFTAVATVLAGALLVARRLRRD